ncbi:MAG: ATP-dependent DNA helicase RecG [Rickettsiales bacterium]|nr:ATP-dependent DNA helicase RecG [Rickettsiales bacterium]
MTDVTNGFLFQHISAIKGVGKHKAAILEELLKGAAIKDLLFHMPLSVIDRRQAPELNQIYPGQIGSYIVTIEQHIAPNQKFSASKIPYRVKCLSKAGIITLNFFQANRKYLTQMLPIGEQRVVSGKIERYHNEISMSHPDYIEPLDKIDLVTKLEVVYPLKHGLFNKQLVKWLDEIVSRLEELPEWNRQDVMKQEQWDSWRTSLQHIHHPKAIADLNRETSPFFRRLAYDEMLAHQLSIQLQRMHHLKQKGNAIPIDNTVLKRLQDVLPFTLTSNQLSVIDEIAHDQGSQYRMVRMLQGDVGSGKTVIALAAMLQAVAAGYQAVLMAPTEILATQHYQWIDGFAEALDLKVVFLTGRLSAGDKKRALEDIQSGQGDIIIGTHALFQEQVVYHRLALAIIDEQHRFGVEQRTQLAAKGEAVDMLLMSATPIPRSLTMTQYGDMECSRLTEKPVGRKPIITKAMPLERIHDVYDGIHRKLTTGAKIYWICPLIEESELIDLAAVQARYDELTALFPGKVGLVHGKIASEERHQTMLSFKDGDIDILVATTVIEVGVNVPEATVMVIEQAERFGLAQLHQLRGRVGRGDEQSSCVLLYRAPLSKTGKDRISILRQTNDGFAIAEEDLRIRGSGDLTGTRQSGVPEFKIADFYDHQQLLKMAHDDAKIIISQDPYLESERGKALRMLLKLFGYHHAKENA